MGSDLHQLGQPRGQPLQRAPRAPRGLHLQPAGLHPVFPLQLVKAKAAALAAARCTLGQSSACHHRCGVPRRSGFGWISSVPLQEHWLAVRRVNSSWYNFNSLFSAPEFLGPLYLSTFLATLREQGYSIFVVQGQLPHRHPDAGSADSPGHWFTHEEVQPQLIPQITAHPASTLEPASQSSLCPKDAP